MTSRKLIPPPSWVKDYHWEAEGEVAILVTPEDNHVLGAYRCCDKQGAEILAHNLEVENQQRILLWEALHHAYRNLHSLHHPYRREDETYIEFEDCTLWICQRNKRILSGEAEVPTI